MSSWAHQKLARHRVKPASTVALLLFLAASDPAGISDFHCEWLLRINHVFTLQFPHPGLIKVQQVIHSLANPAIPSMNETFLLHMLIIFPLNGGFPTHPSTTAACFPGTLLSLQPSSHAQKSRNLRQDHLTLRAPCGFRLCWSNSALFCTSIFTSLRDWRTPTKCETLTSEFPRQSELSALLLTVLLTISGAGWAFTLLLDYFWNLWAAYQGVWLWQAVSLGHLTCKSSHPAPFQDALFIIWEMTLFWLFL